MTMWRIGLWLDPDDPSLELAQPGSIATVKSAPSTRALRPLRARPIRAPLAEGLARADAGHRVLHAAPTSFLISRQAQPIGALDLLANPRRRRQRYAVAVAVREVLIAKAEVFVVRQNRGH